MKKILLAIVVAFAGIFGLASCDKPTVTPEKTPTQVTPEQKTFTVSFETDGGSEVASIEVKEGEKVTLPAAPTKEGVTFGAWYKDVDLTEKFDENAAITEDITLYAQWNVTLTFNSNGGSEVAAITKPYSSKATVYELPAAPTKEGVVFAGWYTDEAFTTELSTTFFPKKNTTAYAKWLHTDVTTEYVVDGFNLLDKGSYAIANNEDGSVTYTCVDRELNVQKLCNWEWEAIKHSTTGADLVNEDGSLKYKTLKVKLQGTAGENIMFKINDIGGAYEKKVDLDGTVQEVEISLVAEGITINKANTSLVIMAQAGVAAAGSNVKISSLYFTDGAAENPQVLDLLGGTWEGNQANVKTAQYVGTADYSFGLVELKQNVDGYQVVSARVKGTAGVGLLLKLEGAAEGAWIETTVQMTGEDQVINWVVPVENLTRGDSNIKLLFCLNPSVAGSANGAYVTIDSIGIQKLVDAEAANKQVAFYFHTNGGSAVDTFYANIGADVEAPTAPTKDGWIFTGWYTDAALTQAYTFGKAPEAAVQLYAGWEKASVDPRTVDMLADTFGTNANITSTVNEDGAWVLKKTAGEWECIASSIKVTNISGMFYLNVEVKGAAGSKILFKIGDINAGEKWVECTGEVQKVVFELDPATLPENNAALVVFPNGGINGASEDFVITKLEFSNFIAGDNMLEVGFGTNANITSTVNEDGAWVLKKTAGEWECIASSIKVSDVTGKSVLAVEVKGAAGSKILFKIGDVNTGEKWVECTGEVQYVEFEYDHATLPANNAALVIFPNGGINGASEDFVITKLEFTNGVNYLDARTGWVNNDKDAYTITEGAGSVTIKKNDSWVNAEGATCGTEWCFAKNIIEVVDGKYTTLVVKFTSDVANQEFIFYFNGKEVKPFTNAGEQEIEIVLDAPITSAELRIFANAGQIGSCTLVITDMYLK